MISKFTKIKGVGRFLDCQFGENQFGRNTIIFGENTAGKSTFTEILWSLKTGDKSYIEGKKSFGFAGNQQVEFFDENEARHIFPSAEWSRGFENIEIFDTHFINENIFEGDEVTYDNQKKLNSIIIGTKGKKLAAEINSLQDDFNTLTTKKTARTSEFNRIFKKEISVKEFTELKKIENVDEKIKELNSRIELLNNQQKVKDVFEALETSLDNVINQSTKQILSKSIEVNADLVSEHILKTWATPTHSKDFLQTGLSLTKSDHEKCVFCGQDLEQNAKELLAAYSKLFSQEYKSFQADITSAVSKFDRWNPVNFIESIIDKLSSVNLTIEINEATKSQMAELKEKVNTSFAAKAKDLDYEIIFDDFDKLIEIFKNIKIQISGLKQKNIFTSEITIDDLNRKIKLLEFSKMRHSKEWIDFLDENIVIDRDQETIKEKRETLRAELDKYSNNLFENHIDTINAILDELNADFAICDFQPIRKLVGQKERIFALKFFKNHKVSIAETAGDKPNFKNTLSESDKRVLAFAFFYSLMMHDNKLEDKIIVIDDPFSSFDTARSVSAVRLLAHPHFVDRGGDVIEKTMNQLIVLTHDREFFKWIYQKLYKPKPLKIIPDGENNGVKKSTIVACDFEAEFE